MANQDLILPLGNAAAGFAPFNGAGPFTLTGRCDKPRFLERPIVASTVLGTVAQMTVARQNVIQSNQPFPLSMLFADQFDDQSASLGMPLAGALDIELVATLDAAGDLSGVVCTTPWNQVETSPEEIYGPSAFNYIFGLGTVAGAGALTMTATATRRVKLGRLVLEAIGQPMDIGQILVAGAEQRSGPGTVRIGLNVASNPFHRQNTDVDGSYIGKWLDGGESITILVTGVAGGTLRGGIFLEA